MVRITIIAKRHDWETVLCHFEPLLRNQDLCDVWLWCQEPTPTRSELVVLGEGLSTDVKQRFTEHLQLLQPTSGVPPY